MIYMDYNATTPVLPEVVDEMLRYMPFSSAFGNASSVHGYGRAARLAVENARGIIADVIGAQPDEVFFTSGGTESNNWAIRGVRGIADAGLHIVTSRIEHHSILNTCMRLEGLDWRIDYVNVDKGCLVDLDHLRELTKAPTLTRLISIMSANNETGTCQPIEEISEIAKENGGLLHTDAIQALGKIRVNVSDFPIDLMSLSAHKVYGPKGIGALYVKKGTPINPLILGGHQERDMRAGTENVPGIVGFGKAVELAERFRKEAWDWQVELICKLADEVLRHIPDMWVNGGQAARLPNTVNLGFKGVDSEALLLMLDQAGIAASSGAACESGSVEPSHVLKAMGMSDEDAASSMRFSIGRYTKPEDIEIVITALKDIIPKLRGLKDSIPVLRRAGDAAPLERRMPFWTGHGVSPVPVVGIEFKEITDEKAQGEKPGKPETGKTEEG